MKTAARRIWKVARLLILAYTVVVALLFFAQRLLMYPGHSTQGDPAVVVTPHQGLELLDLGESVAAYLPADLPADQTEPAPTVLMFYGNGDCLKHFLPFAEQLRRRGLNVAVLEYPGYGMSEGSMSESAAYTAAEAMYDTVVARPEVDPATVIPVGVSLGGGMAIEVAARHDVAALATFSTFTSMPAMAVHVVKIIPPFLVLDDYRNIDKLPAITVPTYIAHGTADGTVPFQMGEQLRDAAGGPVTFVPIDGAGHNDLFEIGGPAMWDDFATWCRASCRDSTVDFRANDHR